MAGFRLKRKIGEEQGEGGVQSVVVGLNGARVVSVGDRLREPRRQLPLSAPAGQESGRRTVRLTLAVPRELHRRLKLAAVRQERTIVSLVSGWIEERTAAA